MSMERGVSGSRSSGRVPGGGSLRRRRGARASAVVSPSPAEARAQISRVDVRRARPGARPGSRRDEASPSRSTRGGGVGRR